MKNKYISFCCIKCKNEITIKNDGFNIDYCPECNFIVEKIFLILNSDNTKAIKKKDIEQKEIKFYYEPKPIFESKVYSNLDSLLKESLLDEKSDFNLGKSDLKQIFKDNIDKNINLLTLDLKSFNELDFNKIEFSNIVVIFYVLRENIAFDLIGNLLDNFGTKLSLHTKLEYGLIFEDSIPKAQMVDIIYA
jgi:hypothetical protein